MKVLWLVFSCLILINLTKFSGGQFGFSLDRSLNDGMNPYLDSHQNVCILQRNITSSNLNEDYIFVLLDLKNNRLNSINVFFVFITFYTDCKLNVLTTSLLWLFTFIRVKERKKPQLQPMGVKMLTLV